MRKHWIILRVVGAVLMTLILIGGGFGLYHLGWSQGYWTGLAAAQAAGTPALQAPLQMPGAPYAAPYFAFHHGFWGMGFLMPLLFVLLLLFVLRMIFRPLMWGGMGPHMHMHHAERWAMMHPEYKKWYEEHAASTETSGKSDKKEDSAKPEA
ncbi:MAG: hypothetical protein LWX83_00800 [Anaerolineae bacterium]|nr:hypothetical protein [Anaerolineae bacterium]